MPSAPPTTAGELETLTTFLDYYREVMIGKVAGVDAAGLRAAPVPSGTCLGGLLKHLAYVERWWFQAVYAGRQVDFPWSKENPDADFILDDHDDADSLITLYRAEIEEARRVVAADPDLDRVVDSGRRQVSLRWILVHMIEEVARHAGHADILREQYDGAVGD
jgi:uncharacterized damage-inducible protein DinB